MFQDLSLKNHPLVPVISDSLNRGLNLSASESANSYAWGWDYETYSGVYIMGYAHLLREGGMVYFAIEINVAFVDAQSEQIQNYIAYRNSNIDGLPRVAINIMSEVTTFFKGKAQFLTAAQVRVVIDDIFWIADLVQADLTELQRRGQIPPIGFWPQGWMRVAS